jgi:hypothetical protein
MLIKYLLPAKQVSYKKLIALMFSIGFCGPSLSQNKFEGLEYLFSTPKSYVVQHTNEALKIDGNLQESAWQKAQWTNNLLILKAI